MARSRTERGRRSVNRVAPNCLRFRIAFCGIKRMLPSVELTGRTSDAPFATGMICFDDCCI
ncbi:hypothetical protein CEE69_26740 [Rhodopirellula bahusiensis]|uniref:Uncharacterized protein n=1 Tax=Rhodopirellula bahusiensis TaxID=2014065 RepID=A0A2G1VZQ6_9BACT|nr:hypothetical protein CEE69_26740 [Rhodopirellula bahusiensis]